MGTICSEAGLVVRSVEEADIPLMARWRSDPTVIEFYSGRDRPLDEAGVRRQYFSTSEKPRAEGVEEYQACIAEMDGRPVGFVQFYRLRRSDSDRFGFPNAERTFGLDFFIGEPSLWGQGLGTRLITLVAHHLAAEKGGRRVVADPRVDNTRSVRALEKAGFRRVRKLANHELFEGIARDCWMMEYP